MTDQLFTDRRTGRPLDYAAWNAEFGLSEWFGVAPTSLTDPAEKLTKHHGTAVDPDNVVALPPEFDDLLRLHFLCINRRATTVLEFGTGKSTRVLAEALRVNAAAHGDYVRENLRRNDPFRVFTVDNFPDWVAESRQGLPGELAEYVEYTVSPVDMTTFNGRVCTLYRQLPNVCPDLIYLDGPSQFGVEGDMRGISTAHKDRLPMAADLLAIEHFLLPGTLIVVDGRTANARFLRANFQRGWTYHAYPEYDIHTFELTEEPLGKWNRRQLDYCLP